MLQEVRSCDTVARYGGDELVVLMTDLASPKDAAIMAERMLEAIGKPIVTTAGELFVSCSIGVSLCPIHGQSLDTLLKAADQAMYSVKQLGREGIALSTNNVQ